MRKFLKEFRKDESGSVLIYATMTMGALLAITAVSVNFGYRHLVVNRLQATADAAALAGASQLPQETNVILQANTLAEANMPDANFGDVLADTDIETGHWDSATRTFTTTIPSGKTMNAVKVTTRRAAANSNAHSLFMAGVAGAPDSVDLAAQAIAWSTPDECLIEGLIAQGKIVLESTNVLDGVCMHGQSGAKVGSDNVFTNASLSMPDLNYLEGGDNPNPGLDTALAERDLSPSDALRIGDILDDISGGFGPYPDYLTGVVTTVPSLPADPVEGTLYVVTDNDVTLSGTVSGFGVYTTSGKKITIASDASLSNMFLATDKNVEAGSNIIFGEPDYCTSGDGSVFMAAREQVKLGSNNSFAGVQIIAGTFFEMGSGLENVAGLSVQSGGDIKMGSMATSDCEQSVHVLFGGSTYVLSLVL